MTTQYAMTAIFNGTTRVYWVVTGAPDNTGAQSGYNTSLLTSIATDYTTTSAVTSTGTTSFSSVWQTALEIDFTSLANQTISSDGSVTVAGLTWNKINSADDRVAMAITNGTGLVIQPGTAGTSGGDYLTNVRSLPALTLSLSSVITNFTLDTPVRVWLYNSADNAAANYDACVLAMERPAGNTNYVIKRGFSGALCLNCTGNYNASNQGQTNSAGVYTNNVIMLESVDGLGSLRARMLAGAFSSGFPGASTLKHVANISGSGGALDNQFVGQAADWNLLIGAQRAGSATSTYSTTIARIRIEYIAINANINAGNGLPLTGTASGRPTAVGSGRLYFTDDAPVVYIDDPTTLAWKQYGIMGYAPAPMSVNNWTVIGNLGLTQKGDAILATTNTAGNSCFVQSVGSPTVPYAVDIMGFHNYQTRTTYPQFGVGFTNGITSGTSTIAYIGRYASSNGWGAFHDTIGTGQGGKVSVSNQDGNFDLIQPGYAMHTRVIYDGTSFIYQLGSDGEAWRLWATENAPFTPTYYGAFVGTDQGGGLSGALVTKLRLKNLPTSTITNMVYNAGTTTVTTSAAHGLATGMSISIRNVVSTGTSPNGIYDSSVVSTGTNTFTVPTSSFTYTSGGTVLNISQ